MLLQITKDYWNAHPEIQNDYKVGDQIEVADGVVVTDISQLTDTSIPKGEQRSSLLDGAEDLFKVNTGAGKITATSKEMTLPSGAVATVSRFTGLHVFRAQRFMAQNADEKSDGSEFMPIIISMCTLIDGKKIAPEDLYEMAGQDVIKLVEEFSAANFS